MRDYGTATWEGGDENCNHKQKTARNDGGRVNTNGFHGSSKADSDKGDMNFRDVCPKCGARRIDQQLGLEKTPEEYVQKMVEIFRECRRVLRDDGTLWLNLSDSYNNTSGYSRATKGHYRAGRSGGAEDKKAIIHPTIKVKDLVGIPWMVAFALRADGWYLRSDIIWHKPNPMPESVTDRPTKSHEYIFLLSKSDKYYYDHEAIKEEAKADSGFAKQRIAGKGFKTENKSNFKKDASSGSGYEKFIDNGKRNKRSVWTIPTKPFKEAHFAVFPPDLIIPCIKAGCPEGGIVLDPFSGSGTTLIVARRLGRKSIGIELNTEYCVMQRKRLAQRELF